MKYCFWYALFFTTSVFAQDSLLYESLIPRHAVKISPLHLFSFYPTIQLAYEFKIVRRITAQLEGGYVLNYKINDNTEYQDKRGAKAKLELHYYMLPSQRAKLIFYGATEIYWNAVNFDRLTSQVECFDIECNHVYTRQYTYKVTYREPGFGFKLGFIKYFSDFFMDINSGWAVRFISYEDPFTATEFVNDVAAWAFPIPNEEDRVTLSPIVGVRFGYRLR